MLPNHSKLASLFLREHAQRPLLVEEAQLAGLTAEPKASQAAITRRAMAGMMESGAPSAIAIVSVYGLLTEDEPWYGTTYERIRENVRAAVEDPNVAGIMLCIDSPGGSTDHAFETADLVAEAAKEKPVWCCADVNACSAAYLIASSADRIYVAPISGRVGSVGVYARHVDYSGMLKKEGIAVTLISAGEGKTNGNPYEPLSKQAKDEIQDEVNRLYGAFVSAVAKRRRMTAEQIVSIGAALKPAADAVAAGLADKVGTFEEAMDEFMSHLAKPSAQASASANSTKEDIHMSEVKQAGAASADPVANAATNEPTFAQAQEVMELCELAGVPGQAKQMANLLASGKSMADVRKAIIDAKAATSQEEIRAQVLAGATGAEKKNVMSAAIDRMAGTYAALARQEGGR